MACSNLNSTTLNSSSCDSILSNPEAEMDYVIPENDNTGPELPSYIFWYVTITNVCICIIGVTGNVLVLMVILRRRDMRTNMNFLLSSLCVADLFVLLICQPSGMVEFYSKDIWNLGEVMCKYLLTACSGISLRDSLR